MLDSRPTKKHISGPAITPYSEGNVEEPSSPFVKFLSRSQSRAEGAEKVYSEL